MENDIESVARNGLHEIAPDIEFSDVNRQGDLREEFDIDSMDFLNLVTRLSKQLSVPIPESDYSKLGSFDALVTYLTSSTG